MYLKKLYTVELRMLLVANAVLILFLVSCAGAEEYCDAETGDCESAGSMGSFQTFSRDLQSSSLWHDNKQFEKVFPLLIEVGNVADEIQHSVTTDSESVLQMEAIASDLDRILHKLHNGTIEVGIVGLQKAGKSTFLNALLGKMFLPSSVESQTATEVIIIHDASKTDGTLYCATGDDIVQIAEGEKIYDELLRRNKEVRSQKDLGLVDCDKLILRAPMQFLMKNDIQNIQVQFADTPGFGEAGKVDVANTVKLAVKEMSAFILILNSEYMESTLELDLLKSLVSKHPDLFSKLNRVLILVNGREGIYRAGSSDNSKSVTPQSIPQYVSQYLRSKVFLSLKELSPDRVLLFNALWALNCRQENTWLRLPERELKIRYHEALLMLNYNNIETEDIPKEVKGEDIKAVCDLLEPISAIEEVESRIWQMVIENGPEILLESVIDDTVGVVNNDFIPAMDDLIAKQNLEKNKGIVKMFEDLSSLIEGLLQDGKSELDSISTSSVGGFISQNHEKVLDSISTLVETRAAGLREIAKQDRTDEAIKPMQTVRDAVPSAVKTKTRGDWNTLTQNIRDSLTKEGADLLVKLKDRFTAEVSQWSVGESAEDDISKVVSNIIKSFKESAASMSISSVSVDFPFESIAISASTLDDSALGGYVATSTDQRYKPEQRKDCSSGFLGFGRHCVKYTVQVPYYVKVYSPSISSFQNAFDSTIESWVELYDSRAKSYLQDVMKAVSVAGKEKLTSIFANPRKMVTESLESSKKVLSESEENVELFRAQKIRLVELVIKLRE